MNNLPPHVRDRVQMTDETLFTTYTLAEYQNVSPRTVQREVARGRLAFVKVGGRRRYRREDVERYLKSQLQRSRFKVIDGGLRGSRG